MNFLGGGERHSTADHRRSTPRTSDGHTASPGDLLSLAARPGDVRNFIHKSKFGRAIGGVVSGVIGSVPIVGGIASGVFDQLRGAGGQVVPAGTGCPPGFLPTPSGCVPRAQGFLGGTLARRFIAERSGVPFTGARSQDGQFPPPSAMQAGIRRDLDLAVDPAAGVPVMGRFGAGTEPAIFMTDTRRCPRRAVLGVDGICYNKGDLRNADRWWPRGRRPLLTGGEMRAISTASSAAKKLQRKQKQLESLGLLKRPAARSRRALPAGHAVGPLTHG